MDWLTKIVPGNAPDGLPVLSVLAKQTYRFANGQIAKLDEAEQIPFIESDEYWGAGKPESDAVRLDSDLVAFKPMTDVILIGKAYAPQGKKAFFLDIGIQIGTAQKILRVFGDRNAYVTGSNLAFSDAEAFSEMPLDYGRAYGGKDEKSDEGVLYVYPKNPVGKGFVVKSNPKAIQDLVLPNIEDPKKLLTPQNIVMGRFDRWKEWPDPAGFGYRSKSSYPRYTLAGLPPDQWAEAEEGRQKESKKAPEAGMKPTSQPAPVQPMMNPQFFNGASSGLMLSPLQGNEAIKLVHLDPDFHQFAFTFPGTRPMAWLDVGEGPVDMAMSLHTAVIYKETNQLTLVWRGCTYYKGLEAMKDFTAFEFGVKES